MLCRSALSEDQCNAPGIKHLDEKLCSCSVPKTIKRLPRVFGRLWLKYGIISWFGRLLNTNLQKNTLMNDKFGKKIRCRLHNSHLFHSSNVCYGMVQALCVIQTWMPRHSHISSFRRFGQTGPPLLFGSLVWSLHRIWQCHSWRGQKKQVKERTYTEINIYVYIYIVYIYIIYIYILYIYICLFFFAQWC